MKQLYMRTIVGSSGRDCISYYNLMALNLGFLKVIYSGWVSVTPNLHIGRKTNPILI